MATVNPIQEEKQPIDAVKNIEQDVDEESSPQAASEHRPKMRNDGVPTSIGEGDEISADDDYDDMPSLTSYRNDNDSDLVSLPSLSSFRLDDLSMSSSYHSINYLNESSGSKEDEDGWASFSSVGGSTESKGKGAIICVTTKVSPDVDPPKPPSEDKKVLPTAAPAECNSSSPSDSVPKPPSRRGMGDKIKSMPLPSKDRKDERPSTLTHQNSDSNVGVDSLPRLPRRDSLPRLPTRRAPQGPPSSIGGSSGDGNSGPDDDDDDSVYSVVDDDDGDSASESDDDDDDDDDDNPAQEKCDSDSNSTESSRSSPTSVLNLNQPPAKSSPVTTNTAASAALGMNDIEREHVQAQESAAVSADEKKKNKLQQFAKSVRNIARNNSLRNSFRKLGEVGILTKRRQGRKEEKFFPDSNSRKKSSARRGLLQDA